MSKTLFNLLLGLFFSFTLQAQKSPAAYSDKIINQQHKVTGEISRFFKLLKTASLEDLEKERATIVKKLESGISKVSAMPAFEGDSSLKMAALKWFHLYESSFEKEFVEMLPLVANKNRSSEENNTLKKLAAALIEKEEEIDLHFAEAQEAFVKKHGLELVDVPIK
jgi:hypothetical protein